MGLNLSTTRARQAKTASAAAKPAHAIPEDMAVDSHEPIDGVGNLGTLKVKDEMAWKSSERPRSALKHSGSCKSTDSEFAERTPSGSSRFGRKVSFKVNGLAPPPEAAGPKEKRLRAGDESSMKKLVDVFYGKVMEVECMKPFFDDVDMAKLKLQQEALMLLLFGGNDLLEDELPGMQANLRLIHLHLLAEGLSLDHWQVFADKFKETLGQVTGVPADAQERALAYMQSTRHWFQPLEPGEWPPAKPYRGWTKRSCPFAAPSMAAKQQQAAADAAAPAPAVEEGQGQEEQQQQQGDGAAAEMETMETQAGAGAGAAPADVVSS